MSNLPKTIKKEQIFKSHFKYCLNKWFPDTIFLTQLSSFPNCTDVYHQICGHSTTTWTKFYPFLTTFHFTFSNIIVFFFLQDLSALIIPAALKPPSKPWMGFKLEWSDSKYNLRGRKRPADPTREKREGSRKKRNEKKKSPQAKVKTEHSVRIWLVTFHKSN